MADQKLIDVKVASAVACASLLSVQTLGLPMLDLAKPQHTTKCIISLSSSLLWEGKEGGGLC